MLGVSAGVWHTGTAMEETRMADVTLRGGRVIDPLAGSDERRDLHIVDGRIAKSEVPDASSGEVVDVTGMMVVPGLIDFHVHVYEGVSHYGIDADTYCIQRGVTSAVDAGSAGAQTFPGFHRFIMSASRTGLYAYLNISTTGLLVPEVGELEDARHLVPDKAVRLANDYPDALVGIKVRIGRRMTDSDPGKALRIAKAVGRETGLPIMVHITDTKLPLKSVLESMTEGDVITHCFHGKRGGVIGDDGRVWPYVRDAIDRGVRLDVGHGRGSFSFDVARTAIAEGVAPHHVSSDLHIYCADGPAYDLVTTMSKLIQVGMSLEDTIASVTSRPATALGQADELGSLQPGTVADVTVLEILQGRWEFPDTEGGSEVVENLLVPRWVIKSGEATRLDYSVHEN